MNHRYHFVKCDKKIKKKFGQYKNSILICKRNIKNIMYELFTFIFKKHPGGDLYCR